MPMPSRPLEQRLLRKLVVDENGCWIWQGQPNHRYGTLKEGPSRRTIGAHRAAYTVWLGEIPPGMLVCHKCDVPKCCNPDHLFLGTHADNAADRDRKGRLMPRIVRGKAHYNYKHGKYSDYAPAVKPPPKGPRSHCGNQHELTPENTYVHRGHKVCRTCQRAAKHRYRQRQKMNTDENALLVL